MNYRHLYHAGNFADVLKHSVLTLILAALKRKDSPFCYLDTHAGIGYYDLHLEAAQKTQEYTEGILKILHAESPPALLTPYFDVIRQLNNTPDLCCYPGSPVIAKHLMRAQDDLILCELHPEDVQTLKHAFHADAQVAVHHVNGYHGMKAFLPPAAKRGLILVDPAYERPQELDDVLTSLMQASKRFAHGIYAIWYPLKSQGSMRPFLTKCRQALSQPMLQIELSPYAGDSRLLNGSGMLVINPPYQLDTQVSAILPWLWQHLSYQQQGSFLCQTL